MRRLQSIIIGMLSSVLLAGTAAAQGVTTGDEVRIQIRGGAQERYEIVRLRGTVLALEAGRLSGEFNRGPRSMRLDSIVRMDVARERTAGRGALRGALIGAASAGAIGFLLGFTNPWEDSGPLISESVDSGLMVGGMFAVPGLAIGAGIGLAVPGRRWVRVIPRE